MSRAMVTLVLDRERRAVLAAGARATAIRLSWADELDRLDSALRSIVADAGAPPAAAGAA